MYKSLTTALICLMFGILTSGQTSAQELFSKDKKGGGLSEAFADSGQPKSNTNATNNHFDFDRMEKYVKDRDFEKAKKIGDYGYSFDYKNNKWTIPVDMAISKSGTNLWFTLILDAIDKDVDPNEYADRFIQLLANNGSRGDMFFRYSPKTRLICLIGAIQLNGPVTDERIDVQLKKMVDTVEATKHLWNTQTWSDAPKHVGQWQSDDQSMKLNFVRNGRFELKTQSSTSAGKYVIDAGNISLQENDGEKIEGTIRFTDSNHFELNVNGNLIKFIRS